MYRRRKKTSLTAVFVRIVMPVVLAATAVVGIAGTAAAEPLAPLHTAKRGERVVPDQYLVVLRTKPAKGQTAPAITRAKAAGIKVMWEFSVTLHGYAATLTPDQLMTVRKDPDVARIVENHAWEDRTAPEPVESAAFGPPVVSKALNWGLDRIDQPLLPLDGFYRHQTTGKDVNAYIIGSGIRRTHQEFGDRVQDGFTTVFDAHGFNDCPGEVNGTLAAGVVGGATSGVAKEVSLIPVRIKPCNGMPSDLDFLAAIEFITAEHLAKGGPSVALMTIAHSNSDLHFDLDLALAKSVWEGVVWVTASWTGPENQQLDACLGYPGSLGFLIHPGGSTKTDHRSGYSLIGDCLDFFAPSHDVRGPVSNNDDGFLTSKRAETAAAYAAGVAALHLEVKPTAAHIEIKQRLIQDATPGILHNIGAGSPNLLLFSLTQFSSQWNFWVQDPEAVMLTGDFDADGDTDMALTGPPQWHTLPVALSNGDGSFTVSNNPVSQGWLNRVSHPQAQVVTGFFDGDRRTDLLATGGPEGTRPLLLLSNGDGTFTPKQGTLSGNVQAWNLSDPRYKVLAGDLAADGQSDLMIAGPNVLTVPGDAVVTARGAGLFVRADAVEKDWPILASETEVTQRKRVTGDFNGDGSADMAMVGGDHWTSIPVAYSTPAGGFDIFNWQMDPAFPELARDPDAWVLVGDFNVDTRDDLLLVGVDDVNTPLALSKGDGGFEPMTVHKFEEMHRLASSVKNDLAVPVMGDFDGDGWDDFALTGGVGWYTVEIAYGGPGGYVEHTSVPIA